MATMGPNSQYSIWINGHNFIPDKKLEGKNMGEMNRESDDVVRVSPAVIKLLRSDKEAVLKNLQVKILHPNLKIKLMGEL